MITATVACRKISPCARSFIGWANRCPTSAFLSRSVYSAEPIFSPSFQVIQALTTAPSAMPTRTAGPRQRLSSSQVRAPTSTPAPIAIEPKLTSAPTNASVLKSSRIAPSWTLTTTACGPSADQSSASGAPSAATTSAATTPATASRQLSGKGGCGCGVPGHPVPCVPGTGQPAAGQSGPGAAGGWAAVGAVRLVGGPVNVGAP